MGKPTTAAGRREVSAWLATYRPFSPVADGWDDELGAFVRRAVQRLDPHGVASARRVTTVIVYLGDWCVAQAIDLDVEVVFDPDTVERFIASAGLGDRTAATYRSVLRRIGPKLTRRAPWQPRPATVAHRQVAVPYTGVELSALRRDVDRQPTPARRGAGMALVALGAGAGLDGRWVTRVAPEDVTVDEGEVTVRIGDPSARVVPVLCEFADDVAELAVGDKFLVGGRSLSRNRASNLAASLELADGTPRLNCGRLRSTWLVAHMEAGTSLHELVAIAGLKGLTVLSDLLPYVSR